MTENKSTWNTFVFNQKKKKKSCLPKRISAKYINLKNLMHSFMFSSLIFRESLILVIIFKDLKKVA
jgi:hypothetical protein